MVAKTTRERLRSCQEIQTIAGNNARGESWKYGNSWSASVPPLASLLVGGMTPIANAPMPNSAKSTARHASGERAARPRGPRPPRRRSRPASPSPTPPAHGPRGVRSEGPGRAEGAGRPRERLTTPPRRRGRAKLLAASPTRPGHVDDIAPMLLHNGTPQRAMFARRCLTVECDRPRRWAAAFADPTAMTAATTRTCGPCAVRLAAGSVLTRGAHGRARPAPAYPWEHGTWLDRCADAVVRIRSCHGLARVAQRRSRPVAARWGGAGGPASGAPGLDRARRRRSRGRPSAGPGDGQRPDRDDPGGPES